MSNLVSELMSHVRYRELFSFSNGPLTTRVATLFISGTCDSIYVPNKFPRNSLILDFGDPSGNLPGLKFGAAFLERRHNARQSRPFRWMLAPPPTQQRTLQGTSLFVLVRRWENRRSHAARENPPHSGF